jgi:hypothetical protein
MINHTQFQFCDSQCFCFVDFYEIHDEEIWGDGDKHLDNSFDDHVGYCTCPASLIHLFCHQSFWPVCLYLSLLRIGRRVRISPVLLLARLNDHILYSWTRCPRFEGSMYSHSLLYYLHIKPSHVLSTIRGMTASMESHRNCLMFMQFIIDWWINRIMFSWLYVTCICYISIEFKRVMNRQICTCMHLFDIISYSSISWHALWHVFFVLHVTCICHISIVFIIADNHHISPYMKWFSLVDRILLWLQCSGRKIRQSRDLDLNVAMIIKNPECASVTHWVRHWLSRSCPSMSELRQIRFCLQHESMK